MEKISMTATIQWAAGQRICAPQCLTFKNDGVYKGESQANKIMRSRHLDADWRYGRDAVGRGR